MDHQLQCYASAAFGMEGLVADELKQIGMQNVLAENGGVRFSASKQELLICNLCLHFCDRVFVLLAEGKCCSFEDLFQLIHRIEWNQFFSGNESIDISCKCSRSILMSTRDCQSVAKKAVIEKIKSSSGQDHFPETGFSLPIHLSVRNDLVRVLLNTSGEALSRRGYRTWTGEAPIKETLAAALVFLSTWTPGHPLHDPCCGTGTIPIEAALKATHRAPGLNRSFAMENNVFFNAIKYESIRSEYRNRILSDTNLQISGSDIDPAALDLFKKHIHQAGLNPDSIHIMQMRLEQLVLDSQKGCFVCNPPYGERLGEQNQCRKLYRELYLLKQRHPGWRMCVISSDPAFERSFGKRADKKRRLYNGRLECVVYIYF